MEKDYALKIDNFVGNCVTVKIQKNYPVKCQMSFLATVEGLGCFLY